MRKILYIALLSLGACAVNTAFALEPESGEGSEQYYTMGRIVSHSNWLSTFNPAGLAENQVSKSLAEASYGHSFGPYRSVDWGVKLDRFGLKTESFKRMDKLSFYGVLEYVNDRHDQRNWAGNIHPEKSTMMIGDERPGKTRAENFILRGQVAYEPCPSYSLGVAVGYEADALAKRKDARNRNYYMRLDVQPGAMFRSKVVNVGLNLNFARQTETVDYKSYGSNEINPNAYISDAMWFYLSEVVTTGGSGFSTVYYKGSTFGAAAQLEFNIAPGFKFLSQFSADYDYLHRYRFTSMQKLGDDERLTYRYLGAFSWGCDRSDHVLKLRGSWRDAAQYENLQQLEVVPGAANKQQYMQYGKTTKYTADNYTLGADYTLYLKRNEWNSSWIVNVGVDYFKNCSEYRALPSLFTRQISFAQVYAAVTKNFLLSPKAFLDVTLNGGVGEGWGHSFDENIPAGLNQTFQVRQDVLQWEFDYLTAGRYNLGGKVRLTHALPTRIPMSGYAEFGFRSTTANSGMPDTFRRAFMATLGVNF